MSKIEELMKQDLPNLVDERRFKRREPPEPVERDEYGRVGLEVSPYLENLANLPTSANGLRKRFPLISSPFQALIFERQLSDMVASMSNTSSKRHAVECRLKVVGLVLWNMVSVMRATNHSIFT